MKKNILTTMGLLIVFGFALQGIFGIAVGILIAAVVGIIYGIIKKERFFIRWSIVALVIDIACIVLFYGALLHSDM